MIDNFGYFMRGKAFIFIFIFLSVLFFIGFSATAQKFMYKGSVYSDLRLAVPGKDKDPADHDFRFDRSDNSLNLTGLFNWGSVDVYADLSFVFSGRSKVDRFHTLHERGSVDPFYIESSGLYLRINDFVLDGLDLKIGRQIVEWGSADKFNPTSVINSVDLEDPMDFGRLVANEMIVLSYSPGWMIDGDETPIFDEFRMELVYVPMFRSSLLPESGRLAFSEPNQFRNFVNSETLHGLVNIQELFLKYGGEVLYDVRIKEPDWALKNSQVGGKISFSLLGVDFGLMGYYGYDHNNQPQQVLVNAVSSDANVQVLMNAAMPAVAGTKEEMEDLMGLLTSYGEEGKVRTIKGFTDVELGFPRVGVFGAEFSTSLDFLGGMGFWGEATLTFHDDVMIDLDINGTRLSERQFKKGHYWKAVLGIDNTITKWLYVNVQYVRGFVNEFGASSIGNYVVAGVDVKGFNEQALLRVFAILNMDDPSTILYPMLSFKFWQATELVAGALLHFGGDNSTFGNRIVGRNIVFLQGRYSF